MTGQRLQGLRSRIILFGWIMLFSLSLVVTGCTGVGKHDQTSNKIAIAQQYGLPYAPLQVVEELGLIEQHLPGIEVEWRQLGNTAAIREAMLAGELDVGFMAIPPFLIGWDKGMDWKIACGLSTSPVGLVTSQARIQSLKDFTAEDRIALPQPGSVQHILLSMACERELHDPTALDNQLITMAHPDGMNALLARREVTAHFTTPPYLSRELEEEGMRKILDGKEAMGEDFTFIIGVTTASLYNDRPEAYAACIAAIQDAMTFMENYPDKTAEILAKAYGIDQSEVISYLQLEGMAYSLEVKGVMRFAEFMQRTGYLSKSPVNEMAISWENKLVNELENK